MKKVILLIVVISTVSTVYAQNNLGVNQPNPTAKIHITNTENQNSLQVDDEANDATPFVIDSLGNVGVQTATPTVSVDINATDAIGIPNGTTAERPATANVGDMRYNSTIGGMEFYNGTQWMSLMPVGTMQMFGGVQAVVPNGWLICDGSEVSRTTYSQLYLTIGNSFGAGDGATTFNLPDLRGRFPRGTDNGAGNDPDAATRTPSNAGGNTGDAVGSMQDDELVSHTHLDHFYSIASQNYEWSANQSMNKPNNFVDTNSGATGGSETRPKNVSVNFIIKY